MRVTADRLLLVAAGFLVLVGGACGDPTEPLPLSGSIKVSTRTSGDDLDTNGYVVAIRPLETRRAIAMNGVTGFGYAVGTYEVALEGIAENCVVSGSNPRSVTVLGGLASEVNFVIECSATGFRVTTRTTGTEYLDYAVLVTSTPVASVPANGSVVLSRIKPGTYTVSLGFGGDNCTVTGGNSTTVEILNRAVTPILFEVACGPPIRLEQIAFTYDAAAGFARIGFVKPDGSGFTERPSFTERAFGHSPAWSPDGNRLVYSTAYCDEYYGFYCEGGLAIQDPETRVGSVPAEGKNGYEPAWSPSGDAIAFVKCCNSAADGGQLYVMPLDGSPAERLGQPDSAVYTSARDPDWSPDGRRIAFTCVIANNVDICASNRDGSGFVRLTSSPAQERDPAWSPDGRTIAFQTFDGSTAAGTTDIALLAIDGGGVTSLTSGWNPAWSRDGTKIVFARSGGLFTINADGSNLTQLIANSVANSVSLYAPAWRP